MIEWLRQNVVTIAIVAVAVVAVLFVVKLLPRKKVIDDSMKLYARCNRCKWQGTVTKYNKVCRKCASTDLTTA